MPHLRGYPMALGAFKYVFCILFFGLAAPQNPTSMNNSAVIIPIGGIDRATLDNLATILGKRFNLPFKVEVPMEIPDYAFNSDRGQYNSNDVLKELRRYKKRRVLGIIDRDLYVPELNFVFGQADLQGQCALISTIRLRQEFYGLPEDDKIFFERTVKEAVHELGHTYGLRHCSNSKCVMFFSNSLPDTDRKESSFCKSCLKEPAE